ncbi:MAG: FG-GAP-like repeat-containing protein, partial [Verrucomicrobia bacterium]|nr:FG-GAP-like repeat-containing protein [Verrucomicrobiota bacterium]
MNLKQTWIMILESIQNAVVVLKSMQSDRVSAMAILASMLPLSQIGLNSAEIIGPAISAVAPVFSPPGSTVTIMGANFAESASGNIVYFGPVRADVTSASTTSLTVVVPAGATYGSVSLTVNSLTAYSPTPFSPAFGSDGVIDGSTFSERIDVSAGAGAGPTGVALGDFDGDGKPDLVVAPSTARVVVLRNLSQVGDLGGDSFSSPMEFAVPNTVHGVAVGDIDGDGRLDIVGVSEGSSQGVLLLNRSVPGTISFDSPFSFAAGTGNPTRVIVDDLDGDGRTDIIVANANTDYLSIVQNRKSGSEMAFGEPQFIALAGNRGGDVRSVAAGDL